MTKSRKTPRKSDYRNMNKRKIARAAMNNDQGIWQNIWREPRGGPITHISVEDYLKEKEKGK